MNIAQPTNPPMTRAAETDGDITLGPKAAWKGATLLSRRLVMADGATLDGVVRVPWVREEPKKKTTTRKTTASKTATRKTTANRTATKKTMGKE